MSKKERRSVPVLRFKGFTDDWEQRKFGDFWKLKSGKAYKASEYVNKGIPIINGETIKNGEIKSNNLNYLPQRYLLIKDNIILKPDDVVIGLNRPIINNQLKISPIPKNIPVSFLYQRAGKIESKFSNLSTIETYYLLERNIFNFSKITAIGSDQPFIKTSALLSWKFFIPKEIEEKTINKLLAKISTLIFLQQRKLDQFKQLKTMCLANMFFNSANHVTKLRFVGFTDNVEKQSFGNTISHKSGTSIEKYFSPKGQYKVISIGSYGLNGEYIDQGIRAVSNEKTNSHLIRKGELSMVLNDKTDGKILGRTLLINKDNEYVVNQRSEIIKPNPALWDTQFAFTYLNGPFRKKVIRIMQGGTQKYINFSSVEKLNVFLPEVQEQQKIGFLFKKIDAIICHHQQKILSLKQIRKFLLQNLFI